MIYVIVIALVFLICFLLDKGFTKLFRSKPQHRSGLSVQIGKLCQEGVITCHKRTFCLL